MYAVLDILKGDGKTACHIEDMIPRFELGLLRKALNWHQNYCG
jgi:hypothetical protein